MCAVARPPPVAMSELNFPSGPWVGFYTYARRSQRFLMDLILEFRDGIISGDGADGIGAFLIAGRYAQSGECSWTKTYLGRHLVEYAGFREGKGIWGTWIIPPFNKGGFHIWPLGEGGLALEQEEDVEADVPLAPMPAP